MSAPDAAPAGSPSPVGERRVPGLTPTLRRQARLLFRIVAAISPSLAARIAAYLFVRPRARAISTPEAQFLQTARARRVTTAYGTIQLYEWPAAGPTVLVVHGWISHAARLQEIILSLQAQGLRVLACDAPAHGRSSGRQADLLRYREALAAVSRADGPIAGIVAHSFGAMAAVSWLAEDGAAASVRAAVLVGLPRDMGYLLESFILAVDLRQPVVTRLRRLFRARYGRHPEEFSTRELAQSIRIPVLLVHGTDDDLVPLEHAQEIVAALSAGQLHIATGLNHSAPLHDPATVALMVRFLAEQLLKSSDARTARVR
ncbi:MAG TPA: alpha/beta fold hydrolase [Steroidobacteraceae bacterium]|jgi:pimeloyl-ACP methyl ester carboxylesterase|nr:alpha/beta fold hydrolase [Steroidobacteraceae bacterium]